MSKLKGLGVAMITPFQEDGSIDIEALKRLTNHLIDGGVDYLVVQGTTGESPVLNVNEKRQVLDTVLAANQDRVPVLYGIGGNNTSQVISSLKSLEPTGVSGILSVSPYYNKPTQDGIYAHYKALAESSALPIVIYNVPGRTGSNILPDTTLRLASDFKNLVAIKEASGNIEQVMTIIRDKPKGFLVISGDDAITLPLMAAGADGVISVLGNAFPKQFGQMVHLCLDDKFAEARELHYQLLEITRLLFKEGNPAGVKETLKYLGICRNNLRLPLIPVSTATSTEIRNEMKEQGWYS